MIVFQCSICNDVNKDQTLKDKDKDKDQTFKDKDKDWSHLQGLE